MGRHLIPVADQGYASTMKGHTSTGAPILELVKVTAGSILEVVILSAVGYVLARRGIIDKQTQAKINKINVSFFTPALLFSKVAFSLDANRLAELLVVPIGFVCVTVVSASSAWILAKVTRISKGQRNFAIACAISPNSNSLPVALMQSLVLEVPQLHWDEEGEPEDTTDGMLGRALTYLVLFSTLGMFLRWSVGAKLLSSVEGDQELLEYQQSELSRQEHGYRDEEDEQPRTARLVDYGTEESESHPAAANSREPEEVSDRPPPEPLTDGGRPPVPSDGQTPSPWDRSFPNSPRAAPTRGPGEPDELSPATAASQRQPSVLYRFVVRPWRAVLGFMTAPLWAATASLVVALIHPLQIFLDSLEPVVGALQTSGACSVPLTMLVLGAYFVEDQKGLDKAREAPPNNPPKAFVVSSPQQEPPQTTANQVSPAGAPSESHNTAQDNAESKSSLLPWMKNPWKSGTSTGAPSEAGSSYAASENGMASQDDAEDPSTGQRRGEAASNAQRNARSSSPAWSLDAASAWRSSSRGRNSRPELSPADKQERYHQSMERRSIFVAVASRMVICPLVLLPLIAWYAIATRHNVVDDPVFITAACLIIGSPPALTLAQITSQKAAGNSNLQRLISRTICECDASPYRERLEGHGGIGAY